MKKGAMIGIAGGIIAVIVLGIVLALNDSETVKIEEIDLRPTEEITPEIQDKIDDIEKINLENEYSPKDREWITSGPFQIDRSEYVVGEKIFLIIDGVGYQEKGQVAFMRPMNDTHYEVYQTVPFDGTKKNVFNYYIQPQLSKINGLCSIDDITGNWTVVFQGTNYPNLKFEIIDEILPGDKKHYEPVC
jgi:hypothetical protein